jgi:hypothetical protein
MRYADGIRKIRQLRFGGLNHTASAEDGELFDMKNLSGDMAPLMSTRQKRRRYRRLEAGGGLFSWEKLCWVDGTDFVYDGVVRGQVTEGKKVFASVGAWIVIMPDKCCYHVETEEFRSMEARVEVQELTFGNGTLYGEEAAANMLLCPGLSWSDYFSAGDAVTISGCELMPQNNRTVIVREIEGDKLYFYENTFSLGDDGTEEYQEQGQLKVERTVPDLKYICENENRLWGCTDTMIFCSKLGDIFNWNVYDGLESDAWYLEPGSSGRFTGCVSYIGYPVFFKENHIYKVYGSGPSSYQVLGSATLGLLEGCHGSLAVAGETLFYLGRNGIMAYTGGIPQPVGADLGQERFDEAVAGSNGLKYFVSMRGEDGRWWLYVYDTQTGLWHKEDEVRATHFGAWGGNLYMLTQEGDLLMVGDIHDPPEDSEEEDAVAWYAEFADFTEGDPNHKGVSKLQIRLELEDGATMQALMQFDSDGIWRKVGGVLGEGPKRSYYLPIVPRRCDHYRLRLEGLGGCVIHSIARESYSGSEFTNRRN